MKSVVVNTDCHSNITFSSVHLLNGYACCHVRLVVPFSESVACTVESCTLVVALALVSELSICMVITEYTHALHSLICQDWIHCYIAVWMAISVFKYPL